MIQENIKVITGREEFFRSIGWTEFANLQDVLFQLNFVGTLQVDLETSGLSSFCIEKVNSLQIGIPGTQFVFDIPSITGGLSVFKDVIEHKEILGHNLAFDLCYFYQAGIVPRNIKDSMVAEEVLLLGLDFKGGQDRLKNLADVLRRRLNVTLDKSLQETIAQGLNSVEDIKYAARDVMYLEDLKDAQMKAAAAQVLERRIALENKFLPVMAYLEFSGVYVDQEAMYDWIRGVEADEIIALRNMKNYADINWASTREVGELLKTYGIEEYTEKGNYQTDEEVLKKYPNIPIAADLLRLRGLTKLVSTYGRRWFHYIQPDGRIHTKYKQFTEAGRTSCGNTDSRSKKYKPWDVTWTTDKPYPNFQNIPTESEHRGLFKPKKGNVFVICDYGSQESVILAEKSGDKAMIDFFQNGDGDMHSFVTRFVNPELAHLSSEEIARDHPKTRKKNKEGTYALAYGGNGKTVADNLNIPVSEGDAFADRYFTLFSGLKPYYKRCYERALRLGYIPIDTLTGGKRYFDRAKEFQEKSSEKSYWDKYWVEKEKNSKWYQEELPKVKWFHALKSELKKISVNTENQGTAAVMTKLAGIYFFDWIVESGNFGKVLIPLLIHDEFVAENPAKLQDTVAEKLQCAMELAGEKCLKILKIKAIPKIADRWIK